MPADGAPSPEGPAPATIPTAGALEHLLSDLCTELGFCLESTGAARLIANPPEGPEAFTSAVFHAEELDPLADRRLYEQVQQRVARVFLAAAKRAG